MRKITAGLFISLDGVVEAPDQWHFPYFNEEMGAAVDATLGAADTMLFGRKTYDSFAGAWPDREQAGEEDAGFAKKLGDVRKLVVSSQQLDFTWRNSEQVEGDLVEADRIEERVGRQHRDERLDLCRPPAAGRRPSGRAAPAGAPDRRPEGDATVRGRRVSAPAEADLVRDLRDGRPEPRLRGGRARRPVEAGLRLSRRLQVAAQERDRREPEQQRDPDAGPAEIRRGQRRLAQEREAALDRRTAELSDRDRILERVHRPAPEAVRRQQHPRHRADPG